MMENKKMMLDAEERENLKAFNKKVSRKLKNEMNSSEWKLVKLLNGKTKVVMMNECNELKNWDIDDNYKELPQ
jgi:hypothetical protein